jgi:enoyl-CoA hydratase/carnithine racemase
MTDTPFDAELLRSGCVRAALDAGGRLLRVELDDPQRRNAQTPATWAALAHIGQHLPDDVAVVLLTGAGTSFSAGMDRRMFTPAGVPGHPSLADILAGGPDGGTAVIEQFQAAFAWWRAARPVTVAAVQGHAVGAGFQLALAADLMLVADDVGLVMKESAFGLVPDLAGTHPLVAALGYRRALEVCLTARPVGAAEAVATGLAVRSVPPEELAGAAQALVDTLLALVPGTGEATKQLLAGAAARTPAQQQEHERRIQFGRLQALAAMMG